MKHNKTPGIDGFSVEFFKVFWKKLRYALLRSLNYSFVIGLLPKTFRTSLVTLIPKGEKDRTLLKNWRPISLLSVGYKILTSTLARRLREILTSIIHPSQTGFIKNRLITDTHRVVFDIIHYLEANNNLGMLMLIDFEKAFDTVSWDFLYETLDLFGFGDSFKTWIKIFNTNIEAFVIQNGFLSQTVKIQRGIRQGDPISGYLFILCAEIFAILVKNNQEITGIYYGDTQLKLMQFADDTTLFLNGTQTSLQASLNTLEIFGSISGLVMNAEKTKIIWLGNKKTSKDKLKVSKKLLWGETTFQLLGITYCNDLKNISEVNYNIALKNITKLINLWNKRSLTPLGKITVIKTFILAKLNYLMSTLPNPPALILKQINKLVFNFLWSGKTAKVSRNRICKKYINGGLNMIDIETYLIISKVNWIKQLLLCRHKIWNSLFEKLFFDIDSFVKFGPLFLKKYLSKNLNPFWHDVFLSWITFNKKIKPNNKKDILTSPLWFNSKISDSDYFIDPLYKLGATYIEDLLTPEGKVMNFEEVKTAYKINNLNFLAFFKLRKLLNKYLNNYTTLLLSPDHIIPRPFIPHEIQQIYTENKQTKYLYNLYLYDVNTRIDTDLIQKWNHLLNINLNNENWQIIFRICFFLVKDNSLIWFQYKIINHILGVRDYLYKIKIHQTNACRLCNNSPETLLHLFYQCPIVSSFWITITNWLSTKINLNITFDPLTVLLGYFLTDRNFHPTNCLLIVAKSYIFNSAYNNKPLKETEFKKKFIKYFNECKSLSQVNNKSQTFHKHWSHWYPLFSIN
jgi:hypothetical protein